MNGELKTIQNLLDPSSTECLDSLWEFDEVSEDEDEEMIRSNKEALLKIALNFLKKMKKKDLANRLQNSRRSSTNITHAEDVGVDSNVHTNPKYQKIKPQDFFSCFLKLFHLLYVHNHKCGQKCFV